MKQLLALIFASVLGGVITLGGYVLLQPDDTPVVESAAHSLARPVSNINVAPGTKAVPFDFKAAAAKAMPAVVHISASAVQPANNESDNPFRFFFG